MKRNFDFKIIFLALMMICFSLNSNSFSEIEFNAQSKVLSPQAQLKAISNENLVSIDYELINNENAYILINDPSGNNLKVFAVAAKKGKIQVSKTELENAGGKGTYTCVIQVDGAQVVTQPVAILHN